MSIVIGRSTNDALAEENRMCSIETHYMDNLVVKVPKEGENYVFYEVLLHSVETGPRTI